MFDLNYFSPQSIARSRLSFWIVNAGIFIIFGIIHALLELAVGVQTLNYTDRYPTVPIPLDVQHRERIASFPGSAYFGPDIGFYFNFLFWGIIGICVFNILRIVARKMLGHLGRG